MGLEVCSAYIQLPFGVGSGLGSGPGLGCGAHIQLPWLETHRKCIRIDRLRVICTPRAEHAHMLLGRAVGWCGVVGVLVVHAVEDVPDTCRQGRYGQTGMARVANGSMEGIARQARHQQNRGLVRRHGAWQKTREVSTEYQGKN